jgi:hypothetical protein
VKGFHEPSPWHLRWDVATTWALVRFVAPFGDRSLRPEVHLFLADRYGKLAQHHRRSGNTRRASVLERKALEHLRLGGGDLPPAVAVAMPVPRPPRSVNAIGVAPNEPDDAA